MKNGYQQWYQKWLATRYFPSSLPPPPTASGKPLLKDDNPEQETLIVDLIRFICGVYHPSNQILGSDVVPRFAINGWLLRCIKVCTSLSLSLSLSLALV